MDDKRRSTTPSEQLNLPAGFRFHPTDEELVVNYLLHKSEGRPFGIPIIAEVDLYKFDPWELPDKALFGEREWYFFSPRDRKYPNGARPNRAAASGYWKATGTDKPINSKIKKVGVKKALVFYKGKAPKGIKTNWIMHEYRLAEPKTPQLSARKKGSLRLDDWVLCRIYKKSSGAFKVMVPNNSGCSTVMKEEPREELDDVLASLPDIEVNESSKFKVPGFATTGVGGGPRASTLFGSSPAFEEMFSPEEPESSENASGGSSFEQQMSLMHPSSTLTDNTTGTTSTVGYGGYYDQLPSFNNGPYSNSTMVMMNKVNPWAYDAGLTTGYQQQQMPQVIPGNRIINPPPIKLEKVPSNISDILLQIQQQNVASNGKKRTRVADEDDVQSTCRSPATKASRQGFALDFTHQMLFTS